MTYCSHRKFKWYLFWEGKFVKLLISFDFWHLCEQNVVSVPKNDPGSLAAVAAAASLHHSSSSLPDSHIIPLLFKEANKHIRTNLSKYTALDFSNDSIQNSRWATLFFANSSLLCDFRFDTNVPDSPIPMTFHFSSVLLCKSVDGRRWQLSRQTHTLQSNNQHY